MAVGLIFGLGVGVLVGRTTAALASAAGDALVMLCPVSSWLVIVALDSDALPSLRNWRY